MQIIDDRWHMDSHTPAEDDSKLLESIPLLDAPHKGRYLETFKFGFAGQLGKVLLSPRKNQGVGCRVVGLLFSTVANQLLKNTHSRVYIQSDQPVPVRGLLTLSYLCNRQRREEVYQNCTWEYIPCDDGEDAGDYEARVVNIMSSRLTGYEKLRSNKLALNGVRSKLDGLFYNREKRELVIIEVKKRKVDFSEGAAQIVLYYAQAKNSPLFSDAFISSHLITSRRDNAQEHHNWKMIMNSKAEPRFYCKEFS